MADDFNKQARACPHGVLYQFYCRQCDTFETFQHNERAREGNEHDKQAQAILTEWQKLHCDKCRPSSIKALAANFATALRKAASEARAAGAEEMRERAIQMADQEEVPEAGGMPSEIIAAVLARDTVKVEQALIACIVSTKRCIADAIRALGGEQ